MTWNTFILKIQRELCHPKSFGTFEKQAPGLPKVSWLVSLQSHSEFSTAFEVSQDTGYGGSWLDWKDWQPVEQYLCKTLDIPASTWLSISLLS